MTTEKPAGGASAGEQLERLKAVIFPAERDFYTMRDSAAALMEIDSRTGGDFGPHVQGREWLANLCYDQAVKLVAFWEAAHEALRGVAAKADEPGADVSYETNGAAGPARRAVSEDPHLELYARYQMARVEDERLGKAEGELAEQLGAAHPDVKAAERRYEEAGQRAFDLFCQITETPAATPAGLWAQACVLADRLAYNDSEALLIEAARQLAEGLARLAIEPKP